MILHSVAVLSSHGLAGQSPWSAVHVES